MKKLQILILFIFIFLFLLFHFSKKEEIIVGEKEPIEKTNETKEYFKSEMDDELNGIYIESSNGEYVYQMPNEKPKGVILLLHGCYHQSTDFWPRSQTCKNCIGLPVEKRIVKEGLKKSYAMIAISSNSKAMRCWGNPNDIKTISEILNSFYQKHLDENYGVPLHIIGVSSGGSFIGPICDNEQLLKMKIRSVCSQISIIKIEDESKLPPSLFLLMSRDQYLMDFYKNTFKEKFPKSKLLECDPKPISNDYFSGHYGSLSLQSSQLVHEAFLKNKVIDDKFFLNEDPRAFGIWRRVVSETIPDVVPKHDNLIADESGVHELMNLAYAKHEITDDYIVQVLEWFSQNSY